MKLLVAALSICLAANCAMASDAPRQPSPAQPSAAERGPSSGATFSAGKRSLFVRIPEMLRVICAALLLLLPVVWAVPSLVLDYQSGNFLYAVHSRINDGGLIFPVPDVFPSEWDVVVLLGEGEKRASFISICRGHDVKNSLFENLIMKQPVREGSWGIGFLKDGLNAGYFEISEADLPRYHVRGRCYSRSEAVFRIYPNGGSFSINLEAKVQP